MHAEQGGAFHTVADDYSVELTELADFGERDFVASVKIGGSQNILSGFEGQKNFFQSGQHGAFDDFNTQRPQCFQLRQGVLGADITEFIFFQQGAFSVSNLIVVLQNLFEGDAEFRR